MFETASSLVGMKEEESSGAAVVQRMALLKLGERKNASLLLQPVFWSLHPEGPDPERT